MNLHEYQGKELFARYGLPVLPGQVAGTPEEARDIAASLGGTVVIKAQVQAGGRGKAGGVKLATTPDEAYEKARGILALTIKGLPVRKVLVAQAADIAKEYYCAIVMDREKKAPLVMLSSEGGVDIEEVAKVAPDSSVAPPAKLPVRRERPDPSRYSSSVWPAGSLKSGQVVSADTPHGRLTCVGAPSLGTRRDCHWN